jgi:signal transduction histidine kinase
LRLRYRSLTFRLVVWYGGLLLIIGGFFAVYTEIGFSYYLQRTMRSTLETRTTDMAALTTQQLETPSVLAKTVEQRFAPAAHDRFMRITLDGKIVYVSDAPADRAFMPADIGYPAADGAELRNDSGLWIFSSVKALSDGRSVSYEAGQLDEAMASARRGLIDTLLVSMPFFLALTALGGFWLVRRALVPIARMINVAEALTFNSPHKRLPVADTGDQLDELGRTLNRMLARLDSAYEHANRFSADAAHELRTPLAIMRGELEFIASRSDLPPELAAAAASAHDESLRLSQLVENLMNLAVVDGIGGKRSHLMVDLRALAQETIDQMKLLAVTKKIDLHTTRGEPVHSLGDRGRLKQALVNLIDNAIKYTPAGGSVVLEVFSRNGHAVLTVVDSGIGIKAENRDNVFERFFRVDPNRGPGGAGLGLAIVKSICVAHSGSISVQSVPGSGSTFTLQLPLGLPQSSSA